MFRQMKIKGLFLLVVACAAGVASETPSGPYPPSGWRPDGPRLELPQKQTASQQPPSAYGAPDTDLSVQGLPVSEQTPLFAETPVSGRQYVGRQFDEDLRRLLDQQRRQAEQQQYSDSEQQQNTFGSQGDSGSDYEDFPSQQTTSPNTFSSTQNRPSQTNTNFGPGNPSRPQQNTNTRFTPQTSIPTNFGNPSQLRPSNPSQSTTPRQNDVPKTNTNFESPQTPHEEQTTEGGDAASNSTQPQPKVSVEISQQSLRQLPDNYPNQLVQLALQQQYPSVQFSQQIGQLQAPIYYTPIQGYSQNLISQPQMVAIESFDPRNPANIAAIDRTIAQRQVTLAQGVDQQGFYASGELVQRQLPQGSEYQQPQYQQNIQYTAPQPAISPYTGASLDFQRLVQVQNREPLPINKLLRQNAIQQTAFLPQSQNQESPVDVYRQSHNEPAAQTEGQVQPNFNQQPQFVQFQERGQSQPNFNQQPQFTQPPSFFQNGLDVNQRDNGFDAEPEDTDTNDDKNGEDSPDLGFPRFGERLPASAGRVTPQRPYGPPPRSGVAVETPTTKDASRADDEEGGSGGGRDAVAVATAVAGGRTRKSSRLRNYRRNIRPLFTLDKNGELVQLQ